MTAINSIIVDGRELATLSGKVMEVVRDAQGVVTAFRAHLDGKSNGIEKFARAIAKDPLIGPAGSSQNEVNALKKQILVANPKINPSNMTTRTMFDIPASALGIENVNVTETKQSPAKETVTINGKQYDVITKDDKKGIQIGKRFYEINKAPDGTLTLSRTFKPGTAWRLNTDFPKGTDITQVKDKDGNIVATIKIDSANIPENPIDMIDFNIPDIEDPVIEIGDIGLGKIEEQPKPEIRMITPSKIVTNPIDLRDIISRNNISIKPIELLPNTDVAQVPAGELPPAVPDNKGLPEKEKTIIKPKEENNSVIPEKMKTIIKPKEDQTQKEEPVPKPPSELYKKSAYAALGLNKGAYNTLGAVFGGNHLRFDLNLGIKSGTEFGMKEEVVDDGFGPIKIPVLTEEVLTNYTAEGGINYSFNISNKFDLMSRLGIGYETIEKGDGFYGYLGIDAGYKAMDNKTVELNIYAGMDIRYGSVVKNGEQGFSPVFKTTISADNIFGTGFGLQYTNQQNNSTLGINYKW